MLPNVRRSFNLSAENTRRLLSVRQRIIYEASWKRSSGSGKNGVTLEGPFGDILREEIEGRFASGPRSNRGAAPDGSQDSGYFIRWGQLCTTVDASFHLLHRLCDQLGLLYRAPTIVTGAMAESSVFQAQRKRSGIDAEFLLKQDLENGLGCCAMRPNMVVYDDVEGTYFPVGVSVVYPENLILISFPDNHREVMIALERTPHQKWGEVWNIYDISDPDMPVWSVWRSVEQWQRARDYRGALRVHAGEAYPLWWDGEPLIPHVPYQFRQAISSLLPLNLSAAQDTLDIFMKRAWMDLVGHVTSFNRGIIISESELNGIRQAMIDPTVINNFWGDANAKIEYLPESTEAVQRLYEISADRIQEILGKYDSGLQVRKSEGVKSGRAIEIELGGLYQHMISLRTKNQEKDQAVFRRMVALHNRLVRSNQLRASAKMVNGQLKVRWLRGWQPMQPGEYPIELLIPESDFELVYPARWNATEMAQLKREILDAVKESVGDPLDWILIWKDWQDTPENRKKALELHREMLLRRLEDIRMGYRVTEDKLFEAIMNGSLQVANVMDPIANDPAKAKQTFIPPRAVAERASMGLQMKRAAKRGGESRQVQLTQRRLTEQEPMTVGNLRDLSAYYLYHADDEDQAAKTGEGTWGDKDKPSAEWIDWCMMGGDEGRDWIAMEFAKMEAEDAAAAAATAEPQDETAPPADSTETVAEAAAA